MIVGDIQSKNADVFLSYSHNDSALVEKIAEYISNSGFSCWIDKNRLRAQENFNAAIDSAIVAEAAPAYLRPKFMAVAVAPVNIKPRQKTIRRTEPS